MSKEHSHYYSAYKAKDPRFDGVFFMGVKSTGIYCRPVCTARLPHKSNCIFFNNAESAEKSGFRPCLRCRPELAPGNAPVDDAQRIAYLIGHRIDEGISEGNTSLEEIASQFQLSSRQIRRIVKEQLGLAPIEIILTRRLLLAKQLLTETDLPVIDVAFASGFSSLRRFNDAFSKRYRMPPSRLRRDRSQLEITNSDTHFKLQLSYRPPFQWNELLIFLKARELKGVECISKDSYARSIRIGNTTGEIFVSHVAAKHSLELRISLSLSPVLPSLLGRLRELFDLNARPDIIASQLSTDSPLASLVNRIPGIRVPGAFDSFEIAFRAILGQQVSVKAATTMAGRFVEAFGEPFNVGQYGMTRFTPTAEQIGTTKLSAITKLGIIETRARTIKTLANTLTSGDLILCSGADPTQTINKLCEIEGIGPWTAQYIAMRVLHWPDAFPKEDLILRRSLGNIGAKEAELRSQKWRPWRSYAVRYLWIYPFERR